MLIDSLDGVPEMVVWSTRRGWEDGQYLQPRLTVCARIRMLTNVKVHGVRRGHLHSVKTTGPRPEVAAERQIGPHQRERRREAACGVGVEKRKRNSQQRFMTDQGIIASNRSSSSSSSLSCLGRRGINAPEG